jgi:carboxypeptidase Taq
MKEKLVEDFKAYLGRIRMYYEAMAVMNFDANTIAPKGSVEQLAKRAGFFGLEVHNMIVSEEMKNFLEGLEPHLSELDDQVQGMYRKTKEHYDEATKLPPEFVAEFAQLTQEANSVWEDARKADNFETFAPYLKRIVEMGEKALEYRKSEMPEGGVPYDIFLDDFEKGMTVKKYDDFFEKLKETVVPLLKQVVASEKKIDKSFMSAKVDIETQRKIATFIAEKIGFDIHRGYIAESAHPFCSGINANDTRITTRYYENDFISSLYSILHECGHAIYDQNIGKDLGETILRDGASMGIHESQSRFYENVIGRSLAFWEYITDELKTFLPAEYKDVTPQMFYEAVNEAKPSLIRVEADELTYSLHVIVRYEIEKMLVAKEITVDELPAIWNKKYHEYLGITPPSNADGVLQDVHWSWGYFGYFPTYALGSAYASQLLTYIQKEMDVDELIRKGDFATITKWLTEKIHRYGATYTPEVLMNKVFGEGLDATHYAKYLKDKFTALYNL